MNHLRLINIVKNLPSIVHLFEELHVNIQHYSNDISKYFTKSKQIIQMRNISGTIPLKTNFTRSPPSKHKADTFSTILIYTYSVCKHYRAEPIRDLGMRLKNMFRWGSGLRVVGRKLVCFLSYNVTMTLSSVRLHVQLKTAWLHSCVTF